MHLPPARARRLAFTAALALGLATALIGARPLAGQTPAASPTPASSTAGTPAPTATPAAPIVSPSVLTTTPAPGATDATTNAGASGGGEAASGQTQTAGGDAGAVRGVATMVAISVAPEHLPVHPEPVDAVFLVLVDATGAATTRATPTLVRLASSDPALASLPASAEIPAGTSALAVPVRTAAPGPVTLTAQSSGLTSGQARLVVSAPADEAEGGALALAFAPQLMLADSAGPALLGVSVVRGDARLPALATAPLEVRLVSSNVEAVRVPPVVTIPAGEFFVTVPVTVGIPGTAKVTALRSGLESATVETSVSVPTAPAARLAMEVVPPQLLAGGSTPARLVIHALAESGAPALLPCGEFELATTVPLVQPVPDRVTPACGEGQQSVLVELARGQAAGATTLTTAAEGLEPVSIELPATGRTAAELAVRLAPAALVYDAPSAGWIAIEVLDRAGSPVTLTGDLTVQLDGPAGAVPSQLVVPAGASYVLAPLGRVAAGDASADITATAAGLAGASASLAQRPPPSAVVTASGAPNEQLSLDVGGVSIPLVWLFVVAVAAVIGVLVVTFLSTRPSRGAS